MASAHEKDTGPYHTMAEKDRTWREAKPQDVADAELAARGSAADVYRGRFLKDRDASTADVALRRPRITSMAALERFEHEVALRARLTHDHVLPLWAACTTPPAYCTVSPWMGGGDLFDAVHIRGVRFDFPRVLALVTQLASAMRYLHDQHVVHRDFKSANCLLDATLANAYVADMDLAIDVAELQRQAGKNNGRAMHRGPSNGRLAHMVGTLVYMAPEVLSGAPHSYAADVYAFAITANEIASATVPFVDRELPVPELQTVLETRFNELTLRAAIVRDDLRPVAAIDVPSQFAALVRDGWHQDPSARPTFAGIVQRLEAIAGLGSENLRRFSAAASTSSDRSNGPMPDRDAQATSALLDEIQACAADPPRPAWSLSDRTPSSSTPRGQEPTPPSVDAAISSTCGDRGEDRMEDASVIQSRLAGIRDAHLMAVFDGHGGAACAEFAAAHIAGALFRAWTGVETSPESALVRAFVDTDAAFMQSTSRDEQSGCTALVALVLETNLHVANAGDCRCIVASKNGSIETLSKDHVATDPDERSRVEARGGYIDEQHGRVQGRLAVSRALGDRAVKRFVTAVPDVVTLELKPDHDFVVLASDGLWDVVSSQEAARLVQTTARSADLAAKRLALKAIELGSTDNISVIVAFFEWGSSEPTSARSPIVTHSLAQH